LTGLVRANAFLAGEALSEADLMAAPHLDYLAHTPEGRELMAGSLLLSWLERMGERPSMAATTTERLRQAA
jgi:glutathione S-transferase